LIASIVDSNNSLQCLSSQLDPCLVDSPTQYNSVDNEKLNTIICIPSQNVLRISSNQRRKNQDNIDGQKDDLDDLLRKAGFGLQSLHRLTLPKYSRPALLNSNEMKYLFETTRKHRHGVGLKSRTSDQVRPLTTNGNALDNNGSVHPVTGHVASSTDRKINYRVTSPYKDCLARDPFNVEWAKIVGHIPSSLQNNHNTNHKDGKAYF